MADDTKFNTIVTLENHPLAGVTLEDKDLDGEPLEEGDYVPVVVDDRVYVGRDYPKDASVHAILCPSPHLRVRSKQDGGK